MLKFSCGTPLEKCCGSSCQTNQPGNKKLHPTPEEAFKCHAKYLVSQGFTQTGPREFQSPNNGPIRVLTRKGKFGAAWRIGKNEKGEARRFVPKNVGRDVKSGTIISC